MKSRRLFIASVVSFLLFCVGIQAFSGDDRVVSSVSSVFTLLLSQDQEKVTKLIRAGQGGSLNLARISINIPAHSLNQDTEITLRSVDVSQYNSGSAPGAVKNLHVIGAVIEPSGIELDIPAVLRFSLPQDWDNKTELGVSFANGSDPLEVLETTHEIIVTGSPGTYVAEIELQHLCVFNVSRICHEGSVNNTVEKFKSSNENCTEEVIKAQVLDTFNIPIEPSDAKLMNVENIQAFLGTYFDPLGSSYGAGHDIPGSTIEYLKEQARKGRQVVIAFNTAETWPKENNDPPYFYPSFQHTANLEYHKDPDTGIETFLVRHTLSHGGFMGPKLKKIQEKMNLGGVISYTDPLENINSFRNTLNGVLFKEYVQSRWPGEFPDDFFNIFPTSYKSVKIYVDRRNNSSQSACDTNLRNRQNCLCSALCVLPGTMFSCSYDIEDKGWSPSCRDVSNGPCICKAYGCTRRQMVTSGDCYDNCMEQYPELPFSM